MTFSDTDHPNNTLPADNLAIFTNFFYRCSDFHLIILLGLLPMVLGDLGSIYSGM